MDFADAQEEWERFSDGANAGSPGTLSNAQATSTNVFWLWSITSLSLMDNVYLGLAVCFPMVFVVLSISTGRVSSIHYSFVPTHYSCLSVFFSCLFFKSRLTT